MKKVFFACILLLQLIFVQTISADIGAANFLADKKIIVDQTQTPELYELEKNIERQAVMKIVMKLSGREVPDACRGEFRDVDKNDWPCKYIESALDADFIAKNLDFRPRDLLTKTEAMKLVLKSRGIEKIQTTDNWQEDYMKTALYNNIIFEPYSDYDTYATRGWLFSIASLSVINEGTAGLTEETVEVVKNPVALELETKQEAMIRFVELYKEEYNENTIVVKKGQKGAVLGSFSLRSNHLTADYTLKEGVDPYPSFSVHSIKMNSLHEDQGSLINTLYLFDARTNTLISQVPAGDIKNGASIVFDFDYAVRGGNYDDPKFEFRADISYDAEPNSLIGLTLLNNEFSLDEGVIDARDENGKSLSQFDGYHNIIMDTLSIQNEGFNVSYNSNGTKYLHAGAQDIPIGTIRITRELGRDHDGKFQSQTLTLEKNENTSRSRIKDIYLVAGNYIYRDVSAAKISGISSGSKTIFNIGASNSEYFTVYVDMTDEGSEEGIRDEFNMTITDLGVVDNNDTPFEHVIGLPQNTQTITMLGAEQYTYADVELIVGQPQEVADYNPIVPDYGMQQKIASFTLKPEKGNVYIKSLVIEKKGDFDNSDIQYVTISKGPPSGTGEPLWSGKISSGGTRINFDSSSWGGVEVFSGVTNTFYIETFGSERLDQKYASMFHISEIDAINESGNLKHNRIPSTNIQGLDIR